jgi:formylglycine-generating enzyme
MSHDCCTPSRADDSRVGPVPSMGSPSAPGRHPIEQAAIPAGTFAMGDPFGDGVAGDGERPVHDVALDAFSIDATTVTNDAFTAFTDATGFQTEAEAFGYSAVFHLALAAPDDDLLNRVAGAPWWVGVRGADWRHPGGRLSDLDGLGDHPVVHISWNDAVAYAEWTGRRLPTEAEWEYASRGGLAGARYPWGDQIDPSAGWQTNIWQGRFPAENSMDDGYLTTAPVRSFPANGYGVYETVGNVWEWCADWFDPRYYDRSPREDPRGAALGSARVMRGGSFLCHDSYCNRYRNAARTSNTPDSSSQNVGFRTVALGAHT